VFTAGRRAAFVRELDETGAEVADALRRPLLQMAGLS
jgi:hypothetical protein